MLVNIKKNMKPKLFDQKKTDLINNFFEKINLEELVKEDTSK